jgi:hypothetical protein
MAKSFSIPADAAAPLIKTHIQSGFSIAAIGRRWTSFFKRQSDRDIERYVQERGGVLTDGLERALERHMCKGTLWE